MPETHVHEWEYDFQGNARCTKGDAFIAKFEHQEYTVVPEATLLDTQRKLAEAEEAAELFRKAFDETPAWKDAVSFQSIAAESVVELVEVRKQLEAAEGRETVLRPALQELLEALATTQVYGARHGKSRVAKAWQGAYEALKPAAEAGR